MLVRRQVFRGEERLQEVLFSHPNVSARTDVVVSALITGDDGLEAVEVANRTTGEKQRVDCDGLFVAIGLIPENGPFAELADLDDEGYFDADESCMTRTPGVFVAGDCRSKTTRQITTAVADGACAALAACRYINMRQ